MSQNKIDICFTIGWLGGGGAERVMLNLIRKLPREKFNVTVISIFKDQLPPDLSYINYKWVFPVKFRGTITILRLFSPQFLYKRIIGSKGDFDIVVSYWEGVTMRIVSGVTDNGGRRPKIINWIHNEFKSLRPLSRMFRSKAEFNRAMDKYDSFAFVADSARQNLTSFMPRIQAKSQTIYNVIFPEEIKEQGRESIDPSLFGKDKINIVSVGRLAKAKGFDRLIRIIGQAKEKGLNVHLYLIGTGGLKEELEQEAARCNVSENITFLGWQSNPHKFVSKADLFVCSSLHEGYSTVVSEALILGTPVITTLCSGMKELIGENNEFGLIVENDEKQLSDAVINVLQNKELLTQLRHKAAQREKLFNTERLVQSNVEFLESLCR